ncbi:MAG: ABC transporter ATP-binding protein/permease [Candidatus Nomurabacteria bacterium]|jgi:ATP-binding cassette subfamily B protein|nr:ABC transporter ATP-binding protein/permease [Candidatus Nomurabacteria bacterium]
MFLKYLRKYWLQIAALLVGLGLQVWSSLALPEYMANIINNGIMNGQKDAIWQEGVRMLGVAAVGGVGMVIAGFFASYIGSNLAKNLRDDVFAKVLSFGINEIDNFSTASLITRTTNDITQIQQVTIMTLRMILQAPLMAVGAIFQAFRTAPSMSWIMWLAVAALLVCIIAAMVIALPKFKLTQKATDKLNQLARENLTGLRVIRAFNGEKREEKRFNGANQELAGLNFFTGITMGTVFPIVSIIMKLVPLLIVWVGAHRIIESGLMIGDMLAFMQYAMQVIMSFMFLSFGFIMVPRGVVSWKRLAEVLGTNSKVKFVKSSVKTAENLETTAPLLQFSNVSYAYNGAEEMAISKITFELAAGETLAIIGGTGAGKTTILNLIMRFFDATEGEVLLSGASVKNLSESDLSDKIGFVPQKNLLFAGTVRENMKLGNDKITDAEIKKALANSMSDDFLKEKEGLETPVAQNGANFSGGQKQRLCIARALAKNPELLIFDDSFSALDLKTDAAVRENLGKHYKNLAKIIVAQRVNTIKHADKIMVIDGGKVVGFGEHFSLLKSNATYREITRSQFSEDEYAEEIRKAHNA